MIHLAGIVPLAVIQPGTSCEPKVSVLQAKQVRLNRKLSEWITGGFNTPLEVTCLLFALPYVSLYSQRCQLCTIKGKLEYNGDMRISSKALDALHIFPYFHFLYLC